MSANSTTNPTTDQALAAVVADLAGHERAGQVEMARAVTRALADDEHLLVEAGTGTGKSLGYLVPALLHAHESGQRVVVATSTLALQRQIVGRDLPAVADVVGRLSGRAPGHAVLKGRSNYACLHRVREGVPDDQGTLVDVPEGGVGAEVVALREWAESQVDDGAEGDREGAPSHTDRAWRQVSVSARECLGGACPFVGECFAERAKARAFDADIVVTNHALLAIHTIGQVPALPEFDAVIIDEAHDLASRVTQSATEHLDPVAVRRVARRAAAHVDQGSLIDDLEDAADELAALLAESTEGRLETLDDTISGALAVIRDTARAAMSQMSIAEGGESADAAMLNAKAGLDELRLTAHRIVTWSPADVVWVGETRNGRALSIAPIDVADELRDKLFAETTCILTSATLQLGGDFTPMARSIGLVDDATWTGLDVGSPFDYPQQGILYAAAHLPPPGRDGLTIDHLGEITKLVKAAGGRTLGLFSSRRAAERAAQYVRESLPDFEILCQGDAHLSELTERFVDEPATSLFGTLGLWQGLDLPGDTCTLVLIDRIPFPRPDDPIMSARSRRVAERGGNGFMQVSAQHAALLLAQGAGRLIRRTTDRGVVAILDPRLVTARYGGFLAASLPPLWRTTDSAVVTAALRRLDEHASLG